MSDPLPPWTPMQQWQHRQTLESALQGDDEHDPEWPALAKRLVPDKNAREGTVQGTWCVLVSQRERIRRLAWDEGVSEGAVLRRVLNEHLRSSYVGAKKLTP